MKNGPFLIGFIVIGAIVAIIYWQFYLPEKQQAQVVITPPVEQPQEAPAIQHPVTATPEELKRTEPLIEPEKPLPELKQSDSSMSEILAKLFNDQKLDRYFIPDHFIERFVVMVDNLPQPQLPTTHRPIKKTPGQFLAEGEREQLTIAPANYKRYTPLVKMLASLDSTQVVAVYKRFYPLFQQAYQELGYPKAYFNDRLIEVIDHLLAAPQSTGPVYLTQPKALYLYADPDLEALSAGRKILLRCGPENAARIKALLQEYRKLLAGN